MAQTSTARQRYFSTAKSILTSNPFVFPQVESHKLRLPVKGTSPPPSTVSSVQLAPVKELYDGWSEYSTTDGRTYYCNKQTGEKSWKLPRKRRNTDVSDSDILAISE
jgi:Splicing factor